jgi:ABC-type sugar transport system ATPase subunit
MDETAASQIAIEARAVTKNFGGVRALRDVSLKVRRGETHALLGQNGAGKSTLIKILNGVYPAGSYGGALYLDGAEVQFDSPADARRKGVAYVPQEIEVLAQLSVAENIFAGQTGANGKIFVDRRALQVRAEALLAELGLSIDPAAHLAHLSAAQRHLVMIARALSTRPRVLMLDEPTASLSNTEVDKLLELLSGLKQRGATILYISHRLAEVLAICDRATVLKDGSVASDMARDEFTQERFIERMSGRKSQALYPVRSPPPPSSPRTPPLLTVAGLSMPRRFGLNRALHDVCFSVQPGEIVGLAGLLGSGRSEILGAIYGSLPKVASLSVDGQAVRVSSPADARALGIEFLTEDRKHAGLLFNLPVGQNITIGNLAAVSRRGVINRGRETQVMLERMRALNVKSPSPAAAVAHLSGGNQQKLLFARALLSKPRLLLLDEPTKGVDAATRQEIYRLLGELADAGVGLIVASSELEEVIGISDRCLVVSGGRIVDTFARGEGAEDRVLRASIHAPT